MSDVNPVQPLTGSPIKANVEPERFTTPTEQSVVEEMMTRVDGSVPEDLRNQLRKILMKISKVFSQGEWDLGWTDLVTHKIDTGDHAPMRQQLRRYPPSHLQAIDEHLQTMLGQGVIEPASSPWSSNAVLAKKKDGSLRCCIDFRQINEITKKDAYPLPRTDQCLNALNGSSWYSTFDLRQGFHQVSMSAEDADKTAFVTRRGMFRFRAMPFGLCNAVATFERLVDLVLGGLNFEICLVYLHDIVLHSATLDQHLERMDILLERLEEANLKLKLKPSKCSLMQREVAFLGHIVSGKGIATDPEKVKLIKEWPTPTNIRQLRGLLGLSGYYRKFVKNYLTIAGPLNDLLRKNRRFQWSTECQEAFNTLKDMLS